MTDDPAERRSPLPYTLKDGNTFLLVDEMGDIHSNEQGLFANDTRVLSKYELTVADRKPSFLGAAISKDNTLFTAHLTNRPLPLVGDHAIPQGVIHIERTRVLHQGRLHECLRLTNFSDYQATVPLKLSYAGDFADIFEVQGHVRQQRGELLAATANGSGVCLSYCGRDAVTRRTYLNFSPRPASVSRSEAEFHLEFSQGKAVEVLVEVSPQPLEPPTRERFDAAVAHARGDMEQRLRLGGAIESSGRVFNQWIDKSHSDLALLTTSLATGPYPYAGIPWFATTFGRDGIITALQTLWLNPQLARGVLTFLASTQAQEDSKFRDSQPGKIMHEARRGEMAALKEVPFGQYYGGVDTTPLFVMLASAYETQTSDRTVVDGIWDALLSAVGWIERRMAASPTGFLDYAAGERTGLVNQAWKDSQDSIFHKNGQFPKGPVAVVEVQGYAYAALLGMSRLAQVRGHEELATRWREAAEKLRHAIEEKFWSPTLGFYAIALDGDGAPCEVYASNAGHLLYCGVPSPERARQVSEKLMSSGFRSGWGIRTLATGQVRYNPMSYHNGSVWPHDTALCTAGIARYGDRDSAVQILSEMFEAATQFGMRLPELFCGFERIDGQAPVPYPVACLPQAWSSGAVFMLLQACLGVEIDAERSEVKVHRPCLPIGIEQLSIHNLPVGDKMIDLAFQRVGQDIVVAPNHRPDSGVRVMAQL